MPTMSKTAFQLLWWRWVSIYQVVFFFIIVTCMLKNNIVFVFIDHSTFFNLLDSTLKSKASPLVAMLNSKECPSLKHMVQKTIQKFTSTESFLDDDTVMDDEDSEELMEKQKPATRTNTKNTTFSHLSSWYSNVVIKTPLIVILQDLEAFSTQQLQDFVLLCRYS